MTYEEEIRIKMGYDATSVTRGTMVMLDAQKKAAMDYVGFWNTALKQRDAAEVVSNDASIARLKTNLAAKAALQKEFFQNQAAQAEIAQGSGGYGSMQGSGAAGRRGGTGGFIGGQVAGDVASGASAHEVVHDIAIGGAVGIGLKAGERAERTVISIIARAFSVVGEAIGLSASTFAAAVLLPLTAILALPAFRTYKAIKDEKSSDKNLSDRSETLADELRKRVEAMQKTKVLDESDARSALDDLAHPTYESVTRVQLVTNSLLEQQKAAEELLKDKKALKVAAKDREESEKIIAEQNERQQKSTAEMSHQYYELVRSAQKIRAEYDKIDQETPTIGDLAGTRFTNRLNKQYGSGGRFDLGRGDGPFSQAARDYELAQKQQMWDIIHGNAQWTRNPDGSMSLTGGQAFKDKQREIAAHNLLANAGIETPAMQAQKLSEQMQDVVDRISQLITVADKTGIVIKSN